QLTPMRDPLARQVEQRDDVVARQQHAIEGTDRRDETLLVLDLPPSSDHVIDRGALHARIIKRAFGHRCLASPAERLLVPRRQRYRPEILDHVEIVSLLAPLILRRVDLADARVDADLLERAGKGQEQSLLHPGCRQNFELERLSRGDIDELAILELIAGVLQELQRLAPSIAVLAR